VVGINTFFTDLPTHENTRVCFAKFAGHAEQNKFVFPKAIGVAHFLQVSKAFELILGFAVSSDKCFNADLDDQLLPATEEYLAMLELDESLIKDEMESENDNKADQQMKKMKKMKKRTTEINALTTNVSQRQRVLARTYNDIMSEKRPRRESHSL
jgi:hypothetical protein